MTGQKERVFSLQSSPSPITYHVCIKPTAHEPPFNGVALCGRSVSATDLHRWEAFKWDEDVIVYVNDTHCDVCMLILMALEGPCDAPI